MSGLTSTPLPARFRIGGTGRHADMIDTEKVRFAAMAGDAEALDIMRGWKKRGRRHTQRLADRYAKTLDKLEGAEKELARAFNKWSKLRTMARRYERELHKLDGEEA